MRNLTRAEIRHLWPNASDQMVDGCFGAQADVYAKCGIVHALHVAHFWAQISHESNGAVITKESLYYTTAKRLMQVWPSRFPTVESATPYLRDERKLANKVYQGRMGNKQPDDGYNFRGRGLLQLTGRESYQRVGKLLGLDLEHHPDLVFAPENAFLIAAKEFQISGCLPLADQDDLRAVTKRVNGGYNGLDSRAVWLTKVKKVLGL